MTPEETRKTLLGMARVAEQLKAGREAGMKPEEVPDEIAEKLLRKLQEQESEEESMSIIEYVTEEVERQGHDTTAIDGLHRVSMMLDAWCYAMDKQFRKPEIGDVPALGSRVERELNKDGIRTCGVRVGAHIAPHSNEILERLAALFHTERRDHVSPLEFYREFEMIHPFVDGNGRTGKILLNWLAGTLHAPTFPAADFWGKPIRNP